MNTVTQLKTISGNIKSKVEVELSRTGGLLRLAPAWVPRSFLQPGLRATLGGRSETISTPTQKNGLGAGAG